MPDVLSEADKLVPAHSSRAPPSLYEQPSLITVKHTEAHANKRTSKICFVPKDYNINAKIVDLVQTQWDLDLPNLLVQCDFGTAHPTSLGTPALIKLPQFEEWLVQSKRHHDRGAAGAGAVAPAIAPASVRPSSLTSSRSGRRRLGAPPSGGGRGRAQRLGLQGVRFALRRRDAGRCDAADVDLINMSSRS